MNAQGIRWLQFAAATIILALGASLIWQCRGEPLLGALAMAMLAASLLSLGLSELALSVSAAGAANPERPTGDPKIDAAIERVLRGIRQYLAINDVYRDNLNGLNEGLSQSPSREKVQDIIVKLMNSNLEMEAKVSALSKELETSQQQIVSLRTNIKEVGKIAMLDALTQLGNRRYFDHSLQTEIERAASNGTDLCLAIADIDRFKSVNDRFGHVVGDHLLRLFADLLGRSVHGKGLAARYGGEEFAVLFPNFRLEEARRVIEGIRHELESKRWVVGPKEERLGSVTASFGIAQFDPNETAESLVHRADAKLFEAKSTGRNRVVIDELTPPGPGRDSARATVVAS